MVPLASIFLPLAVDLIRSYIKSSDSSKDDKILQVVQDGCYYLAPKKNNNLDVLDVRRVSSAQYFEEVE